jgi:hypothetical protein
VLDKPLPDSEVSSYELGKLKLEHEVLEGYFLAPKTYALVKEDSSPIIRNKGLAEVDLKWFIEQYSDIGRITKCTVNALSKKQLRRSAHEKLEEERKTERGSGTTEANLEP